VKNKVILEKNKGTKDHIRIERDHTGHVYIWCACNSHMMTVWWDDDKEFDLIELSFWYMPTWKNNWLQRLRHIWRIIVHGTPYPDHINFGFEETEVYIKILQEFLKKAKMTNKNVGKI